MNSYKVMSHSFDFKKIYYNLMNVIRYWYEKCGETTIVHVQILPLVRFFFFEA